MYKLVVSDMDGSLLNSENKISSYSKDTIKKAIKQGTIFVLATGRIYGAAKVYAKELNLNTPIMACNGGIIRHCMDGKILFDVPIEKEACKKTFEFLNDTDTYFHFYGPDIFYTEKVENESFRYNIWNNSLPKEDRIIIKEVENVYEVLEEDKIYKILIRCRKDIKRDFYANELNKISGITLTSSWFDNFEVCGKNVTKGNAVRRFAKEKNIQKDEIICIGDNINDISMIEYAGLGVAMGNAEESVKMAAKYVAPSNDENGVAEVLEKFLLEQPNT